MIDELAMLGTLRDRCRDAALLLGFADARRAMNECPRSPGLETVANRAAMTIENKIGSIDLHHQRAAGALLSESQASARFRALLAELG